MDTFVYKTYMKLPFASTELVPNGADAKCLRSTSESEYSKVYCITGLCMSIHRSSVSHVRYAEL